MKEMQSGNSKETEVEEKEKKMWTQEKNEIQSEGANVKHKEKMQSRGETNSLLSNILVSTESLLS